MRIKYYAGWQMDRKRARYRNDSTPVNDLLQSCEARGCHRRQYGQTRTRVPIADDARSTRSARSAGSEHPRDGQGEQKPKKRPRKRTQKMVQEEDAADTAEGKNDDSTPKRKKRKAT